MSDPRESDANPEESRMPRILDCGRYGLLVVWPCGGYRFATTSEHAEMLASKPTP